MDTTSLLDRVTSTVTNNFKIFSGGVGDRNYLEKVRNLSSISPITEISIRWEKEKDIIFANTVIGKFTSPSAKELPEQSKQAEFLFVKPKNFSKDSPIVLVLAAAGEEGYTKRLFTMSVPLAQFGVASIILENSYSGSRSLKKNKAEITNSISDFFKMIESTIEEGKSIVHYFHEMGYKKIVVSGVNFGGSISALVAATSRLGISSVPCLAPDSPSKVYTESEISHSIDWSAFKKDFIDTESPLKFIKEIFKEIDIGKIPPPKRADACILVGAKRDNFILPGSIQSIQDHWKTSELRWIDSGHTGSFLFHTGDFRKAILDSIDRI
jgi:hypothetical protein